MGRRRGEWQSKQEAKQILANTILMGQQIVSQNKNKNLSTNLRLKFYAPNKQKKMRCPFPGLVGRNSRIFRLNALQTKTEFINQKCMIALLLPPPTMAVSFAGFAAVVATSVHNNREKESNNQKPPELSLQRQKSLGSFPDFWPSTHGLPFYFSFAICGSICSILFLF